MRFIFEIFIPHEIHTTCNSYQRPNSYELHVVCFSCCKIYTYMQICRTPYLYYTTKMYAEFHSLLIFQDSKHRVVVYILMTCFSVVPMVMIIIANIVMLYIATESRRRHDGHSTPSNKAILTITSVCTLFLISWVPWMVRVGLGLDGVTVGSWYNIFQFDSNLLSCTCNPFIYTIICSPFRQYISHKFSIFKQSYNQF